MSSSSSCNSCSLLIVLGLLMRLKQGRLWVFHRLDRTIVLPNASTLFGICALIYAGRKSFAAFLSAFANFHSSFRHLPV